MNSTILGFNAQIDLGNSLVALATIVLASVSFYISNKSISALKNQHYDALKLQRNLRISEFRRDWIEKLRDELSSFIRDYGALKTKFGNNFAIICTEKLNSGEKIPEFTSLLKSYHHVRLMLNHEEETHKELDDLMNNLIKGTSQQPVRDLSDKAKSILKFEWDKLKRETLNGKELN